MAQINSVVVLAQNRFRYKVDNRPIISTAASPAGAMPNKSVHFRNRQHSLLWKYIRAILVEIDKDKVGGGVTPLTCEIHEAC